MLDICGKGQAEGGHSHNLLRLLSMHTGKGSHERQPPNARGSRWSHLGGHNKGFWQWDK